ncbi:class I SAM-dependent methyltransferase [Spongiactinospora sp. 9N601]|uniref:class I SAM-dependent methyltransferase n=1 Tax=Spongiactinospora sp. 9N601 TaxID=3375149 RepID=UPI00378C2B7D
MTKVDGSALESVAATALWTLRNRALEAARPKSPFSDPLAVQIYQAIDYDYAKFGRPSQSHPLRAMALDLAIRSHLDRHPGAPVVALGEGLQTTYWRLGGPRTDWLSVDLPPVIALRERLLPAEPHITGVPVSVLDRSWMDAVPTGTEPFISAEGLLMYLEPAEALALIADCAARFPGGGFFFDSIPPWFRDRTLSGLHLTARYTAPPMPFALTVSQTLRLPQEIPGVAAARDVPLPAGRGLWRYGFVKTLADLPPLRERRPSITLLTFDRPAG